MYKGHYKAKQTLHSQQECIILILQERQYIRIFFVKTDPNSVVIQV